LRQRRSPHPGRLRRAPARACGAARVSAYDVVCVGSPFLDVTFVGLEHLPGPGEETFARELALTPGGTAITAVGGARVGLRSALLWPRAQDLAGEYLRAALSAEGVDWLGR